MKRQPGSRRRTPDSDAPLRLPSLPRQDVAGRRRLPLNTSSNTQAAPAQPPTLLSATRAAADRAVGQGVPLHQAGRLAEAEACYRQALAVDPAHPDALHLLGLLAHQVGRSDIAISLIQQAISQAISVAADRPSFHLNLGAAFQALGRLDEGVTACRQALALQPAYPEAFNNLGIMLQALGRLDEAIPCFERAIALAPAYADAVYNLGVAHQAAGHPDHAIEQYRAALALRPAYPAASYNLGNALRELKQWQAAADAYEAVLRLDPRHIDATNNLGVTLRELGDRDGAIRCFEQTIALSDAYPQAHANLGHLLRERGRYNEAIQAYRRALALRPDDIEAHSGLILVLDHDDHATPAEGLAERRAWNDRHAAALTAAARPHHNRRDPHRRLRVGYVSGDFYHHSAASGFAPVLLNHDPAQVEVFCYATITQSDARTADFAARIPRWRDVTGWTDAAVAEQVRADEIDILVDLGGHSGSGRLLTFAHKPAPVQVTAWGYITGTGLDAMGYLFADPVAVPPAAERWYTEQVVHLPSIVCFEPAPNLPAVAPPPMLERGFVTFGSFNRPTKLTNQTLDLWARVLVAVPDARMLLKGPGLDDGENRARILSHFTGAGVAAEQVEILGQTPRAEHIAAYSRVDIQLDPSPHGGGATTFEGLMQGIPCVTLLGELIPARLSGALLSVVGLHDLLAETPEQYVEIAARLAADPDRLARERSSLRQRVLASPLGNGPLYTRAVEAAYHELWGRWCRGDLTPDPSPTRRGEIGAVLSPLPVGEGN